MNVERLRFTNQENNDKKVQLGEFLEHISNRNKKNTINNVLSVSNKLGFINQSEQFEDRIVASKNLSNYKIVQKYEFAYNPARINVGSIARLENFESGIVSPMYIVFKTNEKLNSNYLKFFLGTQNFYDQMTKYLVGSVRQTLDFKSLLKIKLNAKSLAEQEKIGNFLSLFDHLIEKLETKVGLLKELKKGYRQSIFSKEIKMISLKETNIDSWDYYHLRDISQEVKRKTSKRVNKVLTISAGKGFLDQSERFSKVIAGNSLKNYNLLYKSEFSYNKGNSKNYKYGCIYPQEKHEEALVPNVYFSFRMLNGDYRFFKYLFENKYMDKFLRRIISSTARMDGLLNVDKKSFFDIKVPFAKIEEQERIGNFLEILDSLIEKQEKELNSIKQLKKGYMQRLFA